MEYIKTKSSDDFTEEHPMFTGGLEIYRNHEGTWDVFYYWDKSQKHLCKRITFLSTHYFDVAKIFAKSLTDNDVNKLLECNTY